jgi:hypothetical protein
VENNRPTRLAKPSQKDFAETIVEPTHSLKYGALCETKLNLYYFSTEKQHYHENSSKKTTNTAARCTAIDVLPHYC